VSGILSRLYSYKNLAGHSFLCGPGLAMSQEFSSDSCVSLRFPNSDGGIARGSVIGFCVVGSVRAQLFALQSGVFRHGVDVGRERLVGRYHQPSRHGIDNP